MNLRSLLGTSLLVSGTLIASFALVGCKAGGPYTAGASEHDDHEILEHAMERMEKSLTAVGKQIDDPAKDASTLEQVATFRKNVAEAQAALPKKVWREADPAKKAELSAKYKTLLGQVASAADELATQLKAGDRSAAKATLDRIGSIAENGHETFMGK